MDSPNGKIALIVDDSPLARRPMRMLLEKRAYDVTERENCESAASLIETIRYDLIVLDVVMPGKDGLTFAKEIRRGELGEVNQQTLILGTSGLILAGHDLSREVSGLDLFVRKGTSLDELETLLNEVIAGSTGQ